MSSRAAALKNKSPEEMRPAQQPVASDVASRSGRKCTVGCKMPNGLTLRLFRFEDKRIAAPGGERTVREAIEDTRFAAVRLLGNAAPFGQQVRGLVQATGKLDDWNGYALTHNVDADFMDEWFRQNPDSDLVKNHIVIVAKSPQDGRAVAREHKDVTSGIEPLNPERTMKGRREVPVDPRWPRSNNPNVKPPKTDTGADDDEAA